MRRLASIGLTVLAVICVLTALTPLQVATCAWSASSGGASGTPGALPAPKVVALQLHGGDRAYGDRLRALLGEALHRRFPGLPPVVDGPPPKGAHLVKVALTSGDVLWTPLHATAELGVQAVFQGPGRARVEKNVRLAGTCSGLVSRGRFQEAFPDEVARGLDDVFGDVFSAEGPR